MQQRLAGKRIVLIGSATGIGAATARRLAAEQARLCLADINLDGAQAVAEELRAQGSDVSAVAIDVADEASVRDGFSTALARLGGLDGVHVNAADMRTLPSDTDALDEDVAVFDRILQVNLRGHFLCTRAALPAMLASGGGAVLYTSSAAADVGEPVRPAYAASKSGLHALMRHVAMRWGKEGVTANALAAGFVMTPERRAKMAAGEGAGSASPEWMDELLERIPSPRFGEVEDLAAMAALLLSEDGRWINGQVIHVNGGSLLR